MRRNWEEFWEVVRPQLTSGRPRKLNRIHQQALLEYLEQRPTAFQDEMSWFLWDQFQLVVAESTIWRSKKARMCTKLKQSTTAQCMVSRQGANYQASTTLSCGKATQRKKAPRSPLRQSCNSAS